MANTNKNNEKQVVEESNVNAGSNSVRSVKQSSKPQKSKKPAKQRKSVGKIAKETVSELKKVSWPTFPKVVKQTGVVITVVVVFTLVLFGIDRLLYLLYTLLVNGVS